MQSKVIGMTFKVSRKNTFWEQLISQVIKSLSHSLVQYLSVT